MSSQVYTKAGADAVFATLVQLQAEIIRAQAAEAAITGGAHGPIVDNGDGTWTAS